MEGTAGGGEGSEAQDEGGAGRSVVSNGTAEISEVVVKYEAVVVCSVVQDKNRFNHLCASDQDAHVEVVNFLLESFESAGLKVQILEGMDHKVFIKVKTFLSSLPFLVLVAFEIWRCFCLLSYR